MLTLGLPLFSRADAYQEALASYRAGSYLEALVAVQNALSREQGNDSYHLLHAKVLAELRQYGDAEKSRRAMASRSARISSQVCAILMMDSD